MSSGCGVFIGDPIQLFPAKAELDGGFADPSAACIEQSQKVSGASPTVIDFPAVNLAALVEGERVSDVVWPGTGITTRVTVTMSSVQVFSVTSRINPAFAHVHTASQCADHVVMQGTLLLKTEDGKLDETVPDAKFVAFDDERASATFAIDQPKLHGSYKPSETGGRCYTRTTFQLLGALNGTSGAMVDELRPSCDMADAGVLTTLAGGHWGPDWRH